MSGYDQAFVIYFPSIAQFALPIASGEKVSGTGSGSLNVGDTVAITLGLVGITQATGQEKMTLSLNTGAVATYDAAASRPGQAYVFKYTVKDDEVASDLSIISVNLNGAVLRDAEGKDALISSDLSLMSGTLKVNGYIGSAGNENFYGTSGAETFEGRGGDDIYRINNVGDRVIERKGDGHDTIVATLDFALAEGVEVETIRAAKSIGAADIKLTGNAFAQTLEGTEGRNVLDGRGGADIMRGKGGDDRYYVDSARDVVIEERGGGFDTILTSVSFALAAGLEIEALEIADPAKSSGSTVRLTGNEFANRLTGDRGDNVLDGGGGIDIMRGLGGNDTYTVDKARDQVIEAKGGGTDTVVTTVSYALTAGQEIEALQLAASTGQANLNLTGNEFANAIRGNDGNNVLDGSSGSDILTGRAGLDAFVFSTKLGAGNVDRITDFAPVDDTIRLSEDIFTALGAGPLRAAAFKDLSVAGAKVDASDRILYDRDTGALSYDADGSGTAKAIKFAVLDNHAKLTHDDFFVV